MGNTRNRPRKNIQQQEPASTDRATRTRPASASRDRRSPHAMRPDTAPQSRDRSRRQPPPKTSGDPALSPSMPRSQVKPDRLPSTRGDEQYRGRPRKPAPHPERVAVPAEERGVVFGIHPVEEALQSGRIIKIMVALRKNNEARGGDSSDATAPSMSHKIGAIASQARHMGIPVEYVPVDGLNRLADGQNHQGILATIAAHSYTDLEEILAQTKTKTPLLLMLDGVQDPANLGSIIRSGAALGAQGIIIPEKGAAQLTAATVRVSAGGIERLPVSRVTNLVNTLKTLKEQGYWSVAAEAEEGRQAPWTISYDVPTVLVMGSEEKGVRRLLADTCDFRVSIPLSGNMESLNVAAATAVMLYEITRQRHSK